MPKMLSKKPVSSSTYWYLFPQHPHWVTLQTILKTELWVHFSIISYHLMFVIWNSSFGVERWLANFESQWLFIILIIDLSALDIIDLKLLFGTKKISLLFDPLIYSTDFNLLFLFFLSPLFGTSSFCFLLYMAMHSSSELHRLFVVSGAESSKPPCLSHVSPLFLLPCSHSHWSPYYLYLDYHLLHNWSPWGGGRWKNG